MRLGWAQGSGAQQGLDKCLDALRKGMLQGLCTDGLRAGNSILVLKLVTEEKEEKEAKAVLQAGWVVAAALPCVVHSHDTSGLATCPGSVLEPRGCTQESLLGWRGM